MVRYTPDGSLDTSFGPDHTGMVLCDFGGVDKARFRKPVVPGDQLIMEIELVQKRSNSVRIHGTAKVEGEVVAEQVNPMTGERFPIRRFQGDLPPTKSVTGRVEAMAHWAGQSVGGVTGIVPAAEIVQELIGEAERLLGRWAVAPAPA